MIFSDLSDDEGDDDGDDDFWKGWFSILSFKGIIFSTMLPDGLLFYAKIKKYGHHDPWANLLKESFPD